MPWKIYQLTYDLLAPLHVGLIKLGNFYRTRYYIPAPTIWGALTAALTRLAPQRGGGAADSPIGNDFDAVGKWIAKNIISSYWYVLGDNSELLYPRYGSNTLYYGTMTEREFERAFVTGLQGTAIDPSSNAAQEGSLREFEVLSPRRKDTGARVQLRGWLLLSQQAWGEYERIGAALDTLVVGGERKYGWGRLRLAKPPHETDRFCTLPSTRLSLASENVPTVLLETDEPLLAHAAISGVEARGAIEAFRGRRTVTGSAFGMDFSETTLCWAPGSLLSESKRFQLSIDRPMETI